MRADLNRDEAVIRRATSEVLEVLSKSHEEQQHKSVLRVVGGKVVYDQGVAAVRK